MNRTRILLLSCNAGELRHALKKLLEETPSLDFEVRDHPVQEKEFVTDNPDLFEVAARFTPHLAVVCLSQGVLPQAQTILDIARKRLGIPFVLATETTNPQDWPHLLNLPVDDFIAPPFRATDVLPRLWRLHQGRNRQDLLVLRLKERLGLNQLIGESPALLTEIQKIPPIARCDATVLIRGETGTGKEMIARAIHFLGARSTKPFNPLNCGAIPMDLMENELFGHDSGAFTGAGGSSIGLIRQTEGGSLFLDEIDCLPLLAQVKLLRFLQEKEFRPLGAHKTCRADVRVIAASNVNLEQAMKQGLFRQDLYYRLNVIRLDLPPLRDRKEDIPILARHFVAKYAAAFDAPARELATSTVRKLMLYDWPGNVRELENVIERSVILSRHPILRADEVDLPVSYVIEPGESFQSLKAKMVARFERGYIQDLLREHNGNITRAAKAAGKHRRAFWEIMRKHNLTVQSQAHN